MLLLARFLLQPSTDAELSEVLLQVEETEEKCTDQDEISISVCGEKAGTPLKESARLRSPEVVTIDVVPSPVARSPDPSNSSPENVAISVKASVSNSPDTPLVSPVGIKAASHSSSPDVGKQPCTESQVDAEASKPLHSFLDSPRTRRTLEGGKLNDTLPAQLISVLTTTGIGHENVEVHGAGVIALPDRASPLHEQTNAQCSKEADGNGKEAESIQVRNTQQDSMPSSKC